MTKLADQLDGINRSVGSVVRWAALVMAILVGVGQ